MPIGTLVAMPDKLSHLVRRDFPQRTFRMTRLSLNYVYVTMTTNTIMLYHTRKHVVYCVVCCVLYDKRISLQACGSEAM